MQAVLDPQVNKGKSPELATDGRPINEPGTYKHKDTGRLFITADGKEGVIQADALMDDQKWHGAWERIGGVPSRVELHKQKEAAVKKVEAAEKAKKLKKAQEELDKAKADQPAPGTGETY